MHRVRALVNIYIHVNQWNVLKNTCSHLYGDLVKPRLNVGNGRELLVPTHLDVTKQEPIDLSRKHDAQFTHISILQIVLPQQLIPEFNIEYRFSFSAIVPS